MARWLLKTEPNEYAYNDLAKVEKDVWDGVRNAAALKHLRAMRPGDLAFIYHTGNQRAIVGVAEVVSEPYPDPQETEEKWAVVDVSARGALPRPVTLREIKDDPAFAGWELVRLPRLSVMPVSEAHWEKVLTLSHAR